MKQQTFITELLNNNDKMVNFERWSYKNMKTCLANHKKLLLGFYGYKNLYAKDIEQSKNIICTKTTYDINDIMIEELVFKMDIQEFLENY